MTSLALLNEDVLNKREKPKRGRVFSLVYQIRNKIDKSCPSRNARNDKPITSNNNSIHEFPIARHYIAKMKISMVHDERYSIIELNITGPYPSDAKSFGRPCVCANGLCTMMCFT